MGVTIGSIAGYELIEVVLTMINKQGVLPLTAGGCHSSVSSHGARRGERFNEGAVRKGGAVGWSEGMGSGVGVSEMVGFAEGR